MSFSYRSVAARPRPAAFLSVLVGLLTALLGQSAFAVTLTWDANGATAGQTDGGNPWLGANQWWTGSANTTWVSGSDAIFGNGGAGGAVTLTAPTTVNSLTFNSFTGTYNLGSSGQAITLNSGITINSSAAAVTISSPVTLGGSQSWTNGSASTFTVAGAVTGGANTLTLDGTGAGLDSLTGGLTFSGAGGLIIGKSGTNGVTINGNTITFGGTGGVTINNGSSAVSLASAASITANQSWTNNSSTTMSVGGALTLTNKLTLAGGTFSFGGSNTGAGGIALNAGTLIGTVGGAFGTATNTLTFGGGNLELRAVATTYSGKVDLSAAGETITINPATTGNGVTHIISGAATLGTQTTVMSAGSLTNTNTAYGLTLSGATSFSAPSSNATFTINGNGIGNGTLTMSGGFNTGGNTDTLTFNTGTGTGVDSAAISGAFTGTAGTLVLAGSAQVTVGTLTTTANVVQINSTTGGVYTSNGASTFTGGVTLTSGTLNINSAGVASASGPLGNGGTFTIAGGTMDNTSGAAVVVANVNPIALNADFAFTGLAGGTHDLTLPGAVTLGGSGATRTITANAGNLTLSGNIASTADNMAKSGNGQVTLSGTNNATFGTYTVNAGTLKFAAPASLYNSTQASWTAANIDVKSGATLMFGVGASQFTAANIDTILLKLSTAAPNQGFESGASLGLDSSTAAFTYSSIIANTNGGSNVLGVTTAGTNTTNVVTLSGLNTYTGPTIVNGGALAVTPLNGGVASNLGASSNAASNLVLANGATLTIGSPSDTDRLFSMTSGGATINHNNGGLVHFTNTGAIGFAGPANTTNTLTFDGDPAGSPVIFDPQITDNGSGATRLSFTRTGPYTITNLNTFSGATSVGAAGTSLFTHLANGGITSLTITTNGTTSATLNGTTGLVNGTVYAIAGANIVGGTTFTYSGSPAITLNTAATGSGSGIATTIGVPNGLGISSNLAANLAFNASASFKYIGTGDSTDRNYTLGAAVSFYSNGTGPLTLSGSPTNASAQSITLRGTYTGAANTYSGALANNPGVITLVKNDAGTWVLTNSGNTYTGTTTVSGGILQVGDATHSPTNMGTIGLSVATGTQFNYLPQTPGTLTLGAGSTLSLSAGSTIGLGWGDTVTALGAATVTAPAYINPTGSFTSGTQYTLLNAASGLGTASNFAIANPTNYTFTLSASAGSLKVTPTIATALTTAYWKGGLSGVAAVWAASSGSASNWTTDGVGTATGLVPGAAANVIFSDSGALAANQVGMTLGSNMAVNSIAVSSANPVTLTGPDIYTLTLGSTANAGITVNAGAGAVTLSETIALGVSQTWHNNSSNTFTAGPIINAGNVTPFTLSMTDANTTASNGAIVLGGAISDGGSTGTTALVINRNGNSAVTLSGTNTFTGGVTFTAGTLNLNSATALGGPTSTFAINGGTINSSGVTIANNNPITIGGDFTFTGGANLNLGAGTVNLGGATRTLNAVASTLTLGGIISNGSLSKTGGGTLSLTNAESYTGATTIYRGTLSLGATASLASSGITMSGSATLNYAAGAGTSMSLPALSFSAGDGAAQSTYGSGTDTMTFASLAARTAGATGNFITSGGANGTTNNIVLQNGSGGAYATGAIGPGYFFNGGAATAIYAFYDSGNFVRGINWGVDSGTTTAAGGAMVTTAYAQSTGSTTATIATGQVFTGLNFQNTTATAQSVTVAGAITTDGILRSGNGASTTTISGGTSITTTTAGADLVIRTDMANDALTISTPILANGASGLTKSGAGTLTLSGANTYTGVTTINGGILRADGLANIGVASNIGMGDNTSDATNAASLVINGGQLLWRGAATQSTNRLFTIGTAGASIYSNTVGASINFTNTGALAFTGNGARTLFFGGASNNGNTSTPWTFAPLIGDGPGGASTSPTSVDTSNMNNSGAARGYLLLTGNNTYSGLTWLADSITGWSSLNYITAGTWAHHADGYSNMGAPTTAANGTIVLGDTTNHPGTLVYIGTGETTDRIISLWGGSSGGAGILDQSGSGLLKFTSALGFTLDFNHARTLTLQGSTAGAGEFAGALGNNGTGALAVTKSGTGLWTLSGGNTYTGATTIGVISGAVGSGGILDFANLGSLYNDTTTSWKPANLIVNSGGTLAVRVGAGGSTLTSDFAATGAEGNLDTLLYDTNNGLLTHSNASAGLENGSSIGFDTTNGDFATSTVITNTFSGANAIGVAKLGANTLTLSGNNTFTGAVAVTGGTLTLSGTNTFAGPITVTNGNLNINNSVSGYVGATTTVTNGTLSITGSIPGLTSRIAGQTAALINGAGLGSASSGVGEVLMPSSLPLVGTTAGTTAINTGVTNTQIVPYLLGETASGLGTATGTPNTFLTYTPTGLRPLDPANEFTNNATVNGNNTYITAATNATTTAINSLVIKGNNLTIPTTVTLTDTSGAVLIVSNNNITGAGTGTLAFGSAEGIVTLNSGVSSTISAIVTGTGGMTISGGTLTLSGANTFSGGLTLNSNTATISSAGSGASNVGDGNNAITLNGGVTLNVPNVFTLASTHAMTIGSSGATIKPAASGGTLTLAGNISGTGALAVTFNTSGGSTVLSGDNRNWSGGLNVVFGPGGATYPVTWNGFNASGTGTFSTPAVESGTNSVFTMNLRSDSSGTFLSPNVNNGQAATANLSYTIDVRALSSGSGNVLGLTQTNMGYGGGGGGTFTVNVTGANSDSLSIGTFKINGGTISGNPVVKFNPTTAPVFIGTLNNTIATANSGLTLGGSAFGNAIGSLTGNSPGTNGSNSGVVVNSTGSWTITGANSYTTGFVVTAGTLNVTNGSSLGGASGGAVSVAAGAGLNYAAAADAPLIMHSTLSFTGGGASASTIGGAIGATGGVGTSSAQINATGAITGVNGTSGVSVNVFGINGVTPGTGTYTLLHSGVASTLSTSGATGGFNLGTVYNNTNFTVGAIAASTTDLTASIVSQTPLTSAYWLGGQVTNNGAVWAASDGIAHGNWTTDGAGTATALVPGAGTNVIFSDGSALSTNQASMTLGSNMAINSLTVNNSNPLSLLSAGGYTLTIGSTTSPGITVNGGAGAVALNPNITLGIAQSWTNNSSNALTVGGNVNNGGFLLTVAGTGNAAINGVISGAGGLTMSGSGTLTLTGGNISALAGANTYGGATTITAGTLKLSGIDNVLPTATTLAINGGTLDLNAQNQTVATLTGSGAATNNATGTSTLTVSGTSQFDGIIQDGGSGKIAALTKSTGGTLTLTGASAYSGATTISGGILQISGADNRLPVGTTLTTSGGTLDLNAFNQTVGQLNGSSGFVTNNATGTSTLTVSGTSQYGGTLQDGGSGNGKYLALTKSTGGTLTLTGNSTYNGATNVNAGTLRVGNGTTIGSLGNTAITVAAGATLAVLPGSGISSAGSSSSLTLAGGSSGAAFTMVDNSIGTFHIGSGSLTTTTGSVLPTLTFEIGNSGGSIDELTTGGAATVASGTLLNFQTLSGATSLALGDYTFMTATGGLGPTAFNLANNTVTLGSSIYNFSLVDSTSTAEILKISSGGVPTPHIAITTANHTRALINTNASVNGTYGNTGTGVMSPASIVDNGGALLYTAGTPSNPFTVNTGTSGLPFTGTVATGSTVGAGLAYNVKLTDGMNTASASATLDVVGTRSVASPSTTAIGRVLTATSISGTNTNATSDTIVGDGSHSQTEDATLSYSGPADGNGINLVAGSTTDSAAAGGTRSFTGAFTGTGTTSGSFTVGVSRELSGPQSSVVFAYTADPVAKRTFFSPTVANSDATDLGLFHTGASISVTSNAFTTSGSHDTTTDVQVAGSSLADFNGISLTGTATNFTGSQTTDTRTFVGSASLPGGNLSGSRSLAVTTQESGLGDTYSPVTFDYTIEVTDGLATWTSSATTGSWGTKTNWLDDHNVQAAPGVYAQSTADTATFGGPSTTASTISLDTSNPTLAAITFNAPTTGGIGYTISQGAPGTSRVTLSGGPATVAVNGGTHDAITAPVTVASGGVTISGNGGNGVLAISGSGNQFNGPVAVVGTVTTTISGSNAFNYASSSPASISVGTGMDTPTLVIRPTSGSTVASGVTATVAAGATLELDGMVSALSDNMTPTQRASVQNDGSLVAGDLTSLDHATQQVGGIDGAGTTTVADNASLTADHINQTSLVIGNGSVFTLAPSDMNGNPMGAVSGQSAGSSLVLAGSLAPSSSFIANSGSLLGVAGSASSGLPSLGGVGGSSVNAVPEPSAVVLACLALIGLAIFGRRKSR